MSEVRGEDGGDARDEGGNCRVELFQIWGEKREELGGLVRGDLFIFVLFIVIIGGVLKVENDDGNKVSELEVSEASKCQSMI